MRSGLSHVLETAWPPDEFKRERSRATLHVHKRDFAPPLKEAELVCGPPESGTLVHPDSPLIELGDIERDAPSPEARLRELETEVHERRFEPSAREIGPQAETVEDRVVTLLEVEEAGNGSIVSADAVEALRVLRQHTVVVIEVVRRRIAPRRPLSKQLRCCRLDSEIHRGSLQLDRPKRVRTATGGTARAPRPSPHRQSVGWK